MTVALGMYSIGSVFVCADNHVVSTDGFVTSGFKLNAIECVIGSFAIANAANDANAANMLAEEILNELAKTADGWVIEPAIKKAMTEWHSGYIQGSPPSIQFVLVARLGNNTRRLYFCEPPNTVLLKSLNDWVALGVGAQTLDVLNPEVIRGPLHVREALIRAGYLMYRAKKDHVFLKGSETDVLLISGSTGRIYQPTREEMARAEALGPDVDFILRYCYLGLLGTPRGLNQRDFIKSFKKTYLEKRNKVDAIQFDSLNEIDGIA